MSEFWKDMGIAVTMGLVVPTILLAVVVSLAPKESEAPAQTEPMLQTPSSGQAPSSEQRAPEQEIAVLGENGEVMQMPLSEYLTCVVLAEMPVSFEEEALKAQSVVARTYTLRAANGAAKHEQASVCTNSGCCQGYMAVEAYLSKGGTAEAVQRIRSIVDQTDGQVLTYDGKLIEATYFSCSGGSTEDAVAVWGTDVPYLQSVESPGEEHAAHYTDTVTFAAADFASKLGVKLAGKPADWFGEVTYTVGGGVATMTIGGEVYPGTTLRSLLGLRSTAFEVQTGADTVTVTTHGYGHRVGMSQYGADAMAATGSSYAQILAYYYQGTELTQYND